MRLRLWRLFGAAFLSGTLSTCLVSCSGDEQQGEDIVQQGQEQGQEEGEQGNYGYEGENYGSEEGAVNGVNPGEGLGEEVPAEGGGDELQEIIDGMNGQTPGNEVLAAEPAPPLDVTPPVEASTPVAQQAAAAGMAAAPGLPELGSKMSYVIRRGDTLASVAMKIYGDMEKWREIAEFTGMANPNMIYPGDVIYYQLTDQTTAFAAAYEAVKRAEVVVQPGDTLSTISSRVLGSSQDWKLIWRQNDNIDNPDRLIVGQTLYYVDPGSMISAIDSGNLNHNLATVEVAPTVVQQDVEPAASSHVAVDFGEDLNSVQDEISIDFANLETVGLNSLI